MTVIADTVLQLNGHVTGVIPHSLVSKEVAHRGLSDLRVVDSMHERKALMAELSDGFIRDAGRYRHHGRVFRSLELGAVGDS
jgi:predicted Rossmann-fold nucleotide-binding protein